MQHNISWRRVCRALKDVETAVACRACLRVALRTQNHAPDPNDPKAPWVQQVGLHPRAFYFHNFLTGVYVVVV